MCRIKISKMCMTRNVVISPESTHLSILQHNGLEVFPFQTDFFLSKSGCNMLCFCLLFYPSNNNTTVSKANDFCGLNYFRS